MTDLDIGFLTALQARETWETIKILRSSGLLRNLSGLTKPDDIGIHHVWIKNSSGEAIPPFACMQVDGTEVVGELTYVKVIKPNKTDGNYLFNHDREIEIDGYGMCLPWGVVRMLGGGAAEVNESYGATVDAWTVQREDGGPFVVYGDDNTRENIYRGRIQSASGGGGSMVVFEFDEDEYETESVPTLCSEKSPVEAGSHRVRVINAPCGGSVQGMDDEGYITVNDPGEFLKDRDYRELPGKIGFANLVSGEPEYEGVAGACQWVITWINFFREITIIQNIIFQENKIVLKRKKIVVWDDCFLPDEEILGADCDPEEYV